MILHLVKEQSAPSMGIETFGGNPLQFTCFRSMFRESVKRKIEDLQGKHTCLIKLTTREARELVKPFFHDKSELGFKNAMKLLEKQYRNPHKVLASYRKEIKVMNKIRSGDAVASRQLFNFLMKCQSLDHFA